MVNKTLFITLLITLNCWGGTNKVITQKQVKTISTTNHHVTNNKKTTDQIKNLERLEHEISQLSDLLSSTIVTYPNCYKFIMKHHTNTPIPSGYRDHHTQDLMWSQSGNHYDDFRLFISINKVNPGQTAKCYVNHLISGREPYGELSKRTFFGNNQFLVPKGTQGYLLSSPQYVCGNTLFVTVVEAYSQKIIYQDFKLPANTEIKLPFSGENNQLFEIQIKKTWHNHVDPYHLCYDRNRKINDDARGAIVFYVDHISVDTNKREQITQKINQLKNEYQTAEEEIILGDYLDL